MWLDYRTTQQVPDYGGRKSCACVTVTYTVRNIQQEKLNPLTQDYSRSLIWQAALCFVNSHHIKSNSQILKSFQKRLADNKHDDKKIIMYTAYHSL